MYKFLDILANMLSRFLNFKFFKVWHYFINQLKWHGIKRKLRKFGSNVHVEFPIKLLHPENIELGNNIYISERATMESWNENSIIKIGNNVCMSYGVHIGCIKEIIIEDGVLIAGNVLIEDHFHGNINKDEIDIEPNKRPLVSKGKICIGKNTWIGENVVIMPGVEIGEGCIIGANSTVTKSIPKYSVAVGSPCKVIRRLKIEE